MAESPSTRFAINVNGTPRSLFTVRISNQGSLLLSLKRPKMFRDFGVIVEDSGKTVEHGKEIAEQRFSVHPSPFLPDENVIHYTMYVDGSPKIEHRHYTRAIKINRRFALMFAKRCTDLSIGRYNLSSGKGEVISICEYHPTKFTLFCSVLVGPSGLPFDVPNFDCCEFHNIVEREFGQFKLVLVYSFFSLPSHSTGAISHYGTIDPATQSDEERQVYAHFIDGLYPMQSLVTIFNTFRNLAAEMVSIIKQEASEKYEGVRLKKIRQVLDVSDFYKEGTIGSDSWKRHREKMDALRFGFS